MDPNDSLGHEKPCCLMDIVAGRLKFQQGKVSDTATDDAVSASRVACSAAVVSVGVRRDACVLRFLKRYERPTPSPVLRQAMLLPGVRGDTLQYLQVQPLSPTSSRLGCGINRTTMQAWHNVDDKGGVVKFGCDFGECSLLLCVAPREIHAVFGTDIEYLHPLATR
eukprot:845988-Rhodomonas_salina.1